MSIVYIFRGIILVFLFFIYIYAIHFSVLPFNCNIVLGGISLFLFLFNCYKKQTIVVSKTFFLVLLSFFLIIIVSLISIICNGTSDIWFIKYVFINITTLFAAGLIMRCLSKVYKDVSIEVFVRYFTLAVVLQMILSLFIYFSPDIMDVVRNILAYSKLAESTIDRTEGGRLIGFGTQFFDAGIVNCFTLILIAFVLKKSRLKFTSICFYVISFLLIFITGMMLARTTIIGFIIGCMILLYKSKLFRLVISSRVITIGCSVIFFVTILVLILVILPFEIWSQLSVIFDFGFELLENLFLAGDVSTRSTDVMFKMYIFPDNTSTWLIGDGYWSDPFQENIYYMSTDIGYCRMLFYFGVTGLVIDILSHFILLHQVYRKNTDCKILVIAFFVLFLVLNMKGITSLAFLLFPFLFVNNLKYGLSVNVCKKF